jgi:hypothetical protein
MPVNIARVVDYWDLTALIVLPPAFSIATQTFDPKIRYRRFFVPLIGCIAVFAFCFTSPPRYAAYYFPPNEVRFYGSFKTHKSEPEILEKLTSNGIPFKKDSVGYYQLGNAYYNREDYVLRVGDPQSDSVHWLPIGNKTDSILFVRRKEEPYYILPHYNLDGEELKNVKISISSNGNKGNTVFVQTFQWNSREEFSNKIKRRYKAHFKKLFR